MHIRVIGVGTAQGDDAAGLAVAELLRQGPLPAGVEVIDCPRPGLDLLDDMANADAVVLVDATQSGRAAGTVHRVPADALPAGRGFSSHDLGVAAALELGRALGRLPRRIEIIGIEGSLTDQGALSPAVANNIAAAADAVLVLLADLQRENAVSAPQERDNRSHAG